MHAQGVKQSVCLSVVVVVGTKIARSRLYSGYRACGVCALQGSSILMCLDPCEQLAVILACNTAQCTCAKVEGFCTIELMKPAFL